ncbi:hypothetical protein NMY22_g7359 [Coprinellus aureogranulatus]|nr:hypothetical protein NMY22_g7359 [Coprinellus aureogranulatus]
MRIIRKYRPTPPHVWREKTHKLLQLCLSDETQLKPLALHLSKRVPEEVEYLLHPFDDSEFPADFEPGNVKHQERVDTILSAFQDLYAVTLALCWYRTSHRVKMYGTSFYPMVVERWPSIVSCMTVLLTRGFKRWNDKCIARTWATIIHSVTFAAKEDPHQAEIVVSEYTINSSHLLLCCTDCGEGRYHYLPQHNGACLIASLLHACLWAPETSMRQTLGFYRKQARQCITIALVDRLPDIVKQIEDHSSSSLNNAAATISQITGSVIAYFEHPAWEKEFCRRGYLEKASSFVLTLIRKAQTFNCVNDDTWTYLSTALHNLVACATRLSMDPISAVSQLIAGGFLTCVKDCKLRLFGDNCESIESQLGRVLPFLYYSRPFEGTRRNPDSNWIFELDDFASIGHGNTANIFVDVLHHCKMTYGGKDHLSLKMCSNMKHCSEITEDADAYSELKLCGRCHSTMYCSAKCQEEDWGIHSKECAKLSYRYQNDKVDRIWVSASRKRDQLRTLEMMASHLLPPPVDVRGTTAVEASSGRKCIEPGETTKPFLVYNLDSTLSLFDFGAIYKQPRYIRPSIPLTWFASVVRGMPGIQPWVPRLQKLINEMEDQPDEVILVAGFFRTTGDEKECMMVCATMRYNAAGAEEQRYSVLNSLFCRARSPAGSNCLCLCSGH